MFLVFTIVREQCSWYDCDASFSVDDEAHLDNSKV